MKIRKVKFDNHPILGTIELDFTNAKGETIDTIIIAGENGVGKSVLLESIFELSSFKLNNTPLKEKRCYEVELSGEDIKLLKQREFSKSDFIHQIKDNILKIDIDYSLLGNWNQYNISAENLDGSTLRKNGLIFADAQRGAKEIVKMIYSEAEISFLPSVLKTVTSKNLDNPVIQSEKSNANLATEVTQLLIDIQTLDALEFSDWARLNQGKLIDNDKIDVRIKRFTNAFNFMFPSKRFKKIENVNNEKRVIFEDNGKEMDISKLSSGEKQIVFRGSFLLKDKQSSKGAVVLIDEPEISLHPEWQLKILSFLKSLFTNELGNQTSQLIITTHSPFIIHNLARNKDKVVILKKNKEGKIEVSQNPKFYSWQPEEAIMEAFNINQVLDDNKIVVFVEGETDEKYFNKCFSLFHPNKENIIFNWIGRINEKGNAENTGDTALNNAKSFFVANPNLIKKKVILLYDSDTNKPEEDLGNLLIRKMKENKENTNYQIGIENLLVLSQNFDFNKFYKEKVETTKYGEKKTFQTLDKTGLCKYICDELNMLEQKEILKKINQEIEELLIIK